MMNISEPFFCLFLMYYDSSQNKNKEEDICSSSWGDPKPPATWPQAEKTTEKESFKKDYTLHRTSSKSFRRVI